MNKQDTYKLEEFCNFKYGKMPEKSKISEDNSLYPIYSGYKIVGYYEDWNIEKGSLLVVARGVGGTGDVKLSPAKCYLTNLSISIEVDNNIALNEFLYYYWKIKNLRYLDSGSAQSQITINDLKKVEVSLPSIDVQKEIVSILKAFDDKIENNKKINHHLEELAQAIFRSWFIDFEPFDGIKPSDWEIASLTDIADYLNGLAMQKFRPEKDENSLPVLKIKELRQGAFDKTSDICSVNIKPEYIINDGDVIFSWSGSLLVDFWTGGIGGLNQHLFKVSSQNYDKWFYYSWTKYYLQEFINIAADKATTMGHITRSSLENAKILIPNAKDYEMISSILVPIYDDIIQNRIASRKLAQLRDEILPKLLSGELSINYNTK